MKKNYYYLIFSLISGTLFGFDHDCEPADFTVSDILEHLDNFSNFREIDVSFQNFWVTLKISRSATGAELKNLALSKFRKEYYDNPIFGAGYDFELTGYDTLKRHKVEIRDEAIIDWHLIKCLELELID